MQFTSKGYITLWRDGQQISRHRVAEEAYESASRDSKARGGGGKYTVKYPDREIDLGLLAAAQDSTEYAGLTPTHYVAPYAQVAGATSDLDTTATPFASATSASTPCTLGEAMAGAAAGNIVGVLPGVYTGQDENNRSTPTFRPTNSGTLGNVITFVAQRPAAYLTTPSTNPNRTELSNGVTSWTTTAGLNGCPVIGASSVNYVRFIGFYIDASTSYSHADTGPVTFGGSTGAEIHQCVIDGWTADYIDNFSAIRIDNATGTVIKNNIISGFHRTPTENHNVAGILTYAARSVDIQNNDISDTHTGISIKSGNSPDPVTDGNSGTIAYNKISNVTEGMWLNVVHPAETLDVEYNLIYDYSFIGISVSTNQSEGNATWEHDFHVRNNTIARPTTAGTTGIDVDGIAGSSNEIVDNILVTYNAANGYRAIDGEQFTGANSQFNVFTGNHYYRNGADRWTWGSATGITSLASFESTSGSSGGTTGDPLFTNSAGGDFTLQGGSPAAGVGAYVTGSEVIGLQPTPSL